jgi:HSP20 family protein
MHAIIPPLRPKHADRDAALPNRQPHFECRSTPQALRLEVYMPGVESTGVEITTRGPDLQVVARRLPPVRMNWRALHLEAVQRDYELKLRLGHDLDFDALRAELRDGVLTVVVPKREISVIRVTTRQVA